MSTLEAPEAFDFPFTPYEIQQEFMRELYATIELKKCGIFESPTGTGKSLSLICGSLRWLKDHNLRERSQLETQINELSLEKEKLAGETSDWLTSQSREIEVTRKLNSLKLENTRLIDYYQKIDRLRARKKSKQDKSRFVKKPAKNEAENLEVDQKDKEDDEDLILVDDINDDNDESDEEEEEKDKFVPVKIFICSRTHSQLAQFIGEINKSPFGKDVRVVSLASRKNYCINSEVNRLKNVNLINERCLELQKPQLKSTKKDGDGKTVKRQKGTNCACPYNKQQAIEELRDVILVEAQDIEDLVTSSKVLKACPYYSSRKAVEDAEVVLVPYNTILHRATREANGIKLKNNVVIIDEAHNLLEALAQMYGSEVSHEQLVYSLEQLKSYRARYNTRFSAKNLLCINQLIFVITRLKKALDDEPKKDSSTQVLSVQTFVLKVEIDNYNMFTLVKFIRDSKLAQKMQGFVSKFPDYSNTTKNEVKKGVKSFLASIENKKKVEPELPQVEADPVKMKRVPSNPLLAVVSFLESLTHSYSDGRILVHLGEDRKLQFFLLNSATHFEDLVAEARSIIVAGGTMKPISEFRERLFMNAGVEASRITEFSCGHIVPPENILPLIVTGGPRNETLLFNFENRFKMGEHLTALLKDVCNTIKGGIVVFFPSYKYELWLWERVKSVNFGRPVFREPKDSGSVDSVLENYHKAIYKSECKGALLFSVVGGKLSEGLNFSDDLGRCVIVVGLPYPNVYAPDLKEKMSYLDRTEGSGAGKQFYENLCMKSVNQCIGRAVRHKNDYATVILFDERYARASTKNALPDWLKRSLRQSGYNEAFTLIKQFFSSKNKNETIQR